VKEMDQWKKMDQKLLNVHVYFCRTSPKSDRHWRKVICIAGSARKSQQTAMGHENQYGFTSVQESSGFRDISSLFSFFCASA
jgi:hypothetical protein